MRERMKKRLSILLIPLDPVHDLGLRMINHRLQESEHDTTILPPDLPLEEVVKQAAEHHFDYILVSRTMGYGVVELLARFVDLLDATGTRSRSKIIIGGKAMTPELAAELGFDKGFADRCTVEEAVAYIEGREYEPNHLALKREKRDITTPYSYEVKNPELASLLDAITDEVLAWAEDKTSPGIRRARLREEMIRQGDSAAASSLLSEYLGLCDQPIAEFYTKGRLIKGTRTITSEEVAALGSIHGSANVRPIQHLASQPLAIIFTGSGCPMMDVLHNHIAAEWGVDGTIFICPSWVARLEGLLQGLIAHEEDGTIPTFENIALVKRYLRPNLYFQVRAHRGLNTPEMAVYASHFRVDFAKINPVYGSMNGGTDPARLLLDAVDAIRTVSKANVAFDIPANDELSGIPTAKNFAGMLVTAALARKLGARPILKPLLCFAPYAMIYGQMDNNFVDYNAAKIFALRALFDAPIWTGEPIGFLTHENDRVQSATTTALHAGLAASLGVDMLTFASTDESYSRGPITIAARIDTFNALRSMFRFLGDATFAPTPKCREYADTLQEEIIGVLKGVKEKGSMVDALYEGHFGTREEGANPGRAGRHTITKRVS
jgi:methylmalonyl-CoA mutase cobalamin-binding subunit